nr:hypothetical protein [Clostridia bacterium]
MKQTTAIILLTVLMLSMLIGCSSGDTGTAETTSQSEETTTAEETTTSPLNVIVGDKNYDGMEFNIGYSIQFDKNECYV